LAHLHQSNIGLRFLTKRNRQGTFPTRTELSRLYQANLRHVIRNVQIRCFDKRSFDERGDDDNDRSPLGR
jgi:hypothetical protein